MGSNYNAGLVLGSWCCGDWVSGFCRKRDGSSFFYGTWGAREGPVPLTERTLQSRDYAWGSGDVCGLAGCNGVGGMCLGSLCLVFWGCCGVCGVLRLRGCGVLLGLWGYVSVFVFGVFGVLVLWGCLGFGVL